MSNSKTGLYFLTVMCYGLTILIVMVLINTHSVQSYIHTLKNPHVETIARPAANPKLAGQEGADEINQVPGQDVLLSEIKELSKKINEKPVNARIDRVWKAIPGYNGLEVDIDKSYHLAKQAGKVQLEHLVIKEVEPEVGLEDLPPAPIYRGNPQKPMVAFMVNVAWGTEYLPDMLDIFDDYQVKATFFLDGKWLSRNKEVAQELIKRGHELGNHAYSHPDMRRLSIAEIQEEISKTEALIQELGVNSHYFAPPAGTYDDRVVKVAREFNMHTVMWTLDTVDWKEPSPAEITARIVPYLENGALILMHPTASTVQALPNLIEGALQKELRAGTVSEVLSPERTMAIVRVE
ncbi:polysaccharide deacetylase [Caldalkalibacillus thermarum TA2.A1]|uniref:Polysaccharide deacetylase n=1 Tax=Caldalkalibacillus thermarum (strain TA2.A1) TaxID=986075 RepID=F5L9T5_CALTT|nr:polysaccharide deacetylase family protein [Caldalkalibacillus thermarum]EGL81934.1 polysaccharide deacetylase [Caldalkalibacillus thermarum TA2.A1]QZT32975.1 polysaccharide deacetylase family protein [Caldalkalibacillus thermarum TA2.A1]